MAGKYFPTYYNTLFTPRFTLMVVFFWICRGIDLLCCTLGLVARGFAYSFHPGHAVPWLMLHS